MPESKDAFDPLIGQVDWESSGGRGDSGERETKKRTREREREADIQRAKSLKHYSFLRAICLKAEACVSCRKT